MSSKNAIVIGVSEYEHIGQLANPGYDAVAMAQVFRDLDYTVLLELNPTLNEFLRAIKEFSNKIKYNKDVALFYYSGHGIQVNGENYLLPKDAEFDDLDLVKRQGVGLEEIMGKISEARNRSNIFILDACRNNPFKDQFKSINRGLAEVREMPNSTLIAYAAAAGQVAGDGKKGDKIGIFTGAFLTALRANPTKEIDLIFRDTRLMVKQITGKQQDPWTNHNLDTEHYFKEPSIPKPEVTKPEATEQIKLEYADAIKEYQKKIAQEGEHKYKEILQNLYENGMLTDNDRKTLAVRQQELGISNETANTIEEEIKRSFTDRLQKKLENERQAKEVEKEKLAEYDRLAKEKIQKIEKETKQAELKKDIEQEREEREAKRDIPSSVGIPNNTAGASNDDVGTHGDASSSGKKITITAVAILLLSVIGWFGYQQIDLMSKKNICEKESGAWDGTSCKKSESTSSPETKTITEPTKSATNTGLTQEQKEQARIATEKRAQELARQKQTCEDNGDTWTGNSCKKKAVAPTGGNGKWSAYLGKMNWEYATIKCKSLGMRLPTLDELKEAYATGITESWKTDGYYYWSSTPNGVDGAYLLNVYNGLVYYDDRTGNGHVRCVR